jgi:hypothetical protein
MMTAMIQLSILIDDDGTPHPTSDGDDGMDLLSLNLMAMAPSILILVGILRQLILQLQLQGLLPMMMMVMIQLSTLFDDDGTPQPTSDGDDRMALSLNLMAIMPTILIYYSKTTINYNHNYRGCCP